MHNIYLVISYNIEIFCNNNNNNYLYVVCTIYNILSILYFTIIQYSEVINYIYIYIYILYLYQNCSAQLRVIPKWGI